MTWHPDFTVNDHSPGYGHLMLTAFVTRGYANYTPVVKRNAEALRTALTPQHHSPLRSSIWTEPPCAFHTGVHTDNGTPLPKDYPSQLGASMRHPNPIPHQTALVKAHAKAESKPDPKGDRTPDYTGGQLPIATTHATACSRAAITPDDTPCKSRIVIAITPAPQTDTLWGNAKPKGIGDIQPDIHRDRPAMGNGVTNPH